jgi:hypothetical protein
MDLRERLKKILIGTGMQTPGWGTPTWNNPAGYEFHDAKHAMEAAYLKLLDIEAALDETTQSSLSNELGAEYTAGGALKTHARFTSDEWLVAWREFLSAVQRADDAARSWQKHFQEKS